MRLFVRELDRKLSWQTMPALADWVIEEAIRVQQIPAPTFAEDERATYVAQQFTALGLEDVTIDDQKNVYGRHPGDRDDTQGILITAHTDTVFPAHTDLKIRREANIVYGPGIGDNSMGVAALLGLIHWMKTEAITPVTDCWFVATSCEEGLGNLNGIRAAYKRLKHKVQAVINLEGLAFGHIYHAGIAVHRLRIRAQADGGHSWLHFGRPSAVHGLMKLGAAIQTIAVPASPRTTYNIGMIEGGHAINAIGTQAQLWLDLRSEERQTLEQLRATVDALIQTASEPGLTFEVEVVGDRPAGSIPQDHTLVKGALSALEAVGVRGTLERGSTDGNIPLAEGCPTVTIGITRGSNAHRLDEYIERAPVKAGMRQFILLSLATAHHIADATA